MANINIDDRQVVNRSALSTSIGSSANTTLDSLFATIDSKMVNLASAQTLSSKTLATLTGTVTNDSTSTGNTATVESAGNMNEVIIRLTNGSLTGIVGILAGTSGQIIILENQTGNSVTIADNSGTATAANRIRTGTGGPVTISANASFQFQYDGTTSLWMLVGGTGSGSGSSGSKNYLSAVTTSQSAIPNTGNGNFELGSTAGFSLAHSALTSFAPTSVATAGTPFSSTSGGSAASGNLSFGVVSSGQLAGTYSGSLVSSAASTAGDMVISSAFNIDNEDQAKVMTIKAYYKVQSGAANLNFSGTSANSFALWIYDVTNGAWIQPAGVYNFTQNSGVGYLTGTFQTTSNSTQYQLAILNPNASTGAYTFYLDDIFVGPQTAPIGPAMSDWVKYSPAGTLFAGFGTATGISMYSRRVGDTLQVHGVFTSGTTNGTTAAIPIGYNGGVQNVVIDSTKVDGSVVGSLWIATSNATYFSWSILANVTSGGTVVNIGFQSSTTNALGQSAGNTNGVFSGVSLQFYFEVPIVGWSSNTSMSNDTDTRVVAGVTYASGTTSVANTGSTTVTFNSVQSDSHGAFTSSTTYTIPVTGYYQASAHVDWGTTLTNASVVAQLNILQNGTGVGVDKTVASSTSAQQFASKCTTTFFAKAGDAITVTAAQNGGGSATIQSGNVTQFVINRLSGPAVIAATESVNATYSAAPATGTLTNAFNPTTFGTKVKDTHNAYSGSTYTIPVSGSYSIAAGFQVGFTATASSTTQIQITKNGSTAIATREFDHFPTQSGAFPQVALAAYPFNAGDTIQIAAFCNATLPSYGGAAAYNYFTIARVGN